MYSFSYLEPVCCSMSSSNCCFLTCIQVSQEAGQMVWYSHLFKNFPQFVVIHTIKGFGIVNKAERDVFLELSCFFDDPVDVGILTSGSSAFSKTSLNIRKFTVHILLKPGLENFEHYFTSVWDECSCAIVWVFFGIAFLCDNKHRTFSLLSLCVLGLVGRGSRGHWIVEVVIIFIVLTILYYDNLTHCLLNKIVRCMNMLSFFHYSDTYVTCAQLYLTLCHLMDCSLPGSSVHKILQARILEWVAISFSRGSSWPRDWTCISWVSSLQKGSLPAKLSGWPRLSTIPCLLNKIVGFVTTLWLFQYYPWTLHIEDIWLMFIELNF